MLPDDVLLEIFGFYVDGNTDEDFIPYGKPIVEEWIMLAHVCRRWRTVVFQSPRRLNLRLFCTPGTPARDSLDIWPPFPLIISESHDLFYEGTSSVDNTIEHSGCDRVCQIELGSLTDSQFENVTNSSAIQKPFPELTYLSLAIKR